MKELFFRACHALWLAASVVVILTANVARAGDTYTFDYTLEQKKIDSEQKFKKGVSYKVEHWCYNVTIQNTSFKDLGKVEIKYITFMKKEAPGSNAKPGQPELEGKSGSTTIPVFKNNDKFVFTTEPMQLVSSQLQSGYVWASGGPQSTRDALKGLWMRFYIDGQQVAEYANPPAITTKETWDKQ